MKTWPLIIGLSCVIAIGCNRPTPIIEVEEDKSAQIDSHILNANKYIASTEETEIEAYIGRRGWEMQKLGNGTRLWEYELGKGAKPEGASVVTVRYSVEALNGQKVYDEREESIELGHSESVAGMETAVRHLRLGSKAKVIIPSAMAYGVVGDGNKIGSRMVMVVDMEIMKIEVK